MFSQCKQEQYYESSELYTNSSEPCLQPVLILDSVLGLPTSVLLSQFSVNAPQP